MKLKKAVTILIMCALMQQGTAVFAAVPQAEIGTSGEDKFTIDISMNIDNEDIGKKVNILVLNPGMTVADIGAKADALQMQFTKTADSQNFLYSFPIHLDGANDTGTYKVIVKLEGEEVQETEVFFASADDRRMVINMLNSAENLENFKPILASAAQTLSFGDKVYEALDKDKFAALAYENIKQKALDINNVSEATTRIKELVVLEAYNEGLSSELYDSQGNFLKGNVVDFSTLDKDGADIYKTVFSEILNEEGEKKLQSSLMNNNFKSTDELKKEFARFAMAYAMNNSKTDGNGHIQKILTEQNAALAGIDISDYTSVTQQTTRSKLDTYLMKQSYESADDIPGKIKAGLESIDSSQSSTSPGHSPGGSSPSRDFSTTVPVVAPDENNNGGKEENKELPFNDIDSYQWAKEAIADLYSKGIINGVSQTSFAPAESITREQFVVMLLRAMDVPMSQSDAGFKDVADGSWYEAYVNTAYELNITSGVSGETFGVGAQITRQDFVTMIYRAMKDKIDVNSGEDIVFADDEEIADYAKEAVYALAKFGAVNGFEDGTFRPDGVCTRAQAAKVIYEMIRGE